MEIAADRIASSPKLMVMMATGSASAVGAGVVCEPAGAGERATAVMMATHLRIVG